MATDESWGFSRGVGLSDVGFAVYICGRSSTWSEHGQIRKVRELMNGSDGTVHVVGSGLHVLTLSLIDAGVKRVVSVDTASASADAFVELKQRCAADVLWSHVEGDGLEYMGRRFSEYDVFVIDPLWAASVAFSFSRIGFQRAVVDLGCTNYVWIRAPLSWRKLLLVPSFPFAEGKNEGDNSVSGGLPV